MSFNLVAAWLQQETNTFNARLTGVDAFRASAFFQGEEVAAAYRGTRTDWGAVFEVADRRGWTVTTPLHANAVPAGTLAQAAFEELASLILAPLQPSQPVDAVLLMLHGAMVSERFGDCEGELLRRARQALAPGVPLVVTLDPHANVSQLMVDNADAIVAYRTTPHVDQYETTHRALGLLCRILDEGLRPAVHLARPAVLAGLDSGRTITGQGPMVDALARAAELEAAAPDVLAVSLQAGFTFSDTAEVGPSVAVTSVGDGAAAARIGADLSRLIWDTRAVRTVRLVPLDEAMAAVASLAAGRGPALLVDYTDNPGGGANGDGTALLARMILDDIRNAAFFSVADPEAVQAGFAAGLGAAISIALGGKANPERGGGPINVTGTVRALSDGHYVRKGAYFHGMSANLGPSMSLCVGGIDVIVCTHANQTEEREQFRLFGLEVETLDVIGCKGMNHFRVDLEPLSRGIIFLDSGGICSPDFARLPYRRVRRPIWPLDTIEPQKELRAPDAQHYG